MGRKSTGKKGRKKEKQARAQRQKAHSAVGAAAKARAKAAREGLAEPKTVGQRASKEFDGHVSSGTASRANRMSIGGTDMSLLDAPQPRGLVNLGNTCFFNSAMQNVARIAALKTHFAADPPHEVDEVEATYDPEDEGAMTTAVRSFIGNMWATSSQQVINPKRLFSEVGQKNPRFKGRSQQDAHEVLRFIFDGVIDEENARIKDTYAEEEREEGDDGDGDGDGERLDSRDRERASLSKSVIVSDRSSSYAAEFEKASTMLPKNIVEAAIGGFLVSTIRCLECGSCSSVKEPFLDLSLPLVPRDDLVNAEKQNVTDGNGDSGSQNKDASFGASKSPAPRDTSQESGNMDLDHDSSVSTAVADVSNEIKLKRSEKLDGALVPNTGANESQIEVVSTPAVETKLEGKGALSSGGPPPPPPVPSHLRVKQSDMGCQLGEGLSGRFVPDLQCELEKRGRRAEVTATVENKVTVGSARLLEADAMAEAAVAEAVAVAAVEHAADDALLNIEAPNTPPSPAVSRADSSSPCRSPMEDVEDVTSRLIDPGTVIALGASPACPYTSRQSNLSDDDDDDAFAAFPLFEDDDDDEAMESGDVGSENEGSTRRSVSDLPDEDSNMKASPQPVRMPLMLTSLLGGFGCGPPPAPHGYKSIVGSLENFTEVELLEGDNAYGCDECTKREVARLVRERAASSGALPRRLQQSDASDTGSRTRSDDSESMGSGAGDVSKATASDIVDDVSEGGGPLDRLSVDAVNHSGEGNSRIAAEELLASSPVTSRESSVGGRSELDSCSGRSEDSDKEDECRGSKALEIKIPTVRSRAEKRLMVKDSPKALIVHLKRFMQVGMRGGLRKISGHVQFPVELDLSPFVSPDEEENSSKTRCQGIPSNVKKCGASRASTRAKRRSSRRESSGLNVPVSAHRYLLTGVCVHGGSLHGGHYTAYVREGVESDFRGGWFHCSDSRVTRANENEVLASEAFMLFYEKL